VTAGPIARTATGDVRGRATGDGEEYLGIPYAAPNARSPASAVTRSVDETANCMQQ